MRLTTPYTVRRQTLAGSARIVRILPRRPSRAILDLVSGDALDGFISGQRERFIEELRDLCAIPCEASDRAALDAAARWCRDRLRALDLATRASSGPTARRPSSWPRPVRGSARSSASSITTSS